MKRSFQARAVAQVSMLLLLFNACLSLPIGTASAQAPVRPVRIVAFGDSLTAGLGLRPDDAFPAQLQKALGAAGPAVEVINAGVSGDTTAAGLQRLDWAIPEGADGVILALGANDALRGIDPAETRRNLNEILARLKSRGVEVLLAGFKAPRNFGDDYVRRFDAIFPRLAAEHGALLYPFFLDGVALRGELNLDDGLHPNRAGVAVIVESILPKVLELVRRIETRRAAAAEN